uniref:Conotoxin ar5d n=1 Tax=Conus araneosus TaxID=101286 RepID=CT5D_CONAO|nr:RecName: Full=Conotoxin ar5d [Conus araneosus]
DGCCIAKQCC